MAKVNKKHLVIGDLYYFDENNDCYGYFIGYDTDGDVYFYPCGYHPYVEDTDGTINLFSAAEYEEV
jgi:hypothetical protein